MQNRTFGLIGVVVGLSVLPMLGGCEEKSSLPPPRVSGAPQSSGTVLGKTRDMGKEAITAANNAQAAAANAAGEISGETSIEVGGLLFAIPSGWQRQNPSSPMRAAELKIGDASVWFTTFGAGQGGDDESNINRWMQQVKGEDGQAAKGERSSIAPGGIAILKFASEGTYIGMTGMTPQPPLANARVLRAIADAPGGKVFVSMSGTSSAVRQAEPAWNAMLEGVKKK
ncbi:MAG: hypothetical protein K2X32_00115 [Phycisphaerales bacterium]|nr:hypothetical protein [Phycisphaerales bacterium]